MSEAKSGNPKAWAWVLGYSFTFVMYIIFAVYGFGQNSDRFGAIDTERKNMESFLGESRFGAIQTRVRSLFRELFVDSEVLPTSYKLVTVSKANVEAESDSLTDESKAAALALAEKSTEAMDSLWAAVYLGLERLYLLLAFIPLLLIGALAFGVDGLCRWAIKDEEYKHSSARRMKWGTVTLTGAVVFMPFIALMPMSLPIYMYLALVVVLITATWVTTSNIQK